MRVDRLEGPALEAAPARWLGAVLCQDLRGPDGRTTLSKGHRLERADAMLLGGVAGLHLLWLDDGDVDEDTAALRLARAVAAEGVSMGRPVESQVRLVATHRGLLRVDVAALGAVNALPDVTVFTLPDGMPVEAGRTLAGVKVTPLAVAEAALASAEGRAATAAEGVIRVRPFRDLRVAVIVRERLAEGARLRFETALSAKVGWLGGSVGSVRYLGGATVPAGAIRSSAEGADLLLVAGVASTDPLEATWQAVLECGARPVRRGLPVHPGSSYWLADLEGHPVIGVASCGMFSRRTALDLLLLRCFAGETLDPAWLGGLGHGGLLAPEQAWRFPPAGRGSPDEVAPD